MQVTSVGPSFSFLQPKRNESDCGTSQVDTTAPCRACMKENSPSEMISLFVNITTVEIYKKCTSIEVNDTDQLPSHICTLCHNQLINFNQFRMTCMDSDNAFRQHIAIKLENEEDQKSVLFILEQNSSDRLQKDLEEYTVKDEENISYNNDDESTAGSDIEINNLEINDSKEEGQLKYSTKLYCDICNGSFVKKRCLAAHLRQHVGLMPYPCKKCKSEFVKWNNLSMHYKVKHNGRVKKMDTYICSTESCSESFDDKTALTLHRKEMHTEHSLEPKKLTCDKCDKKFLKQYVLEAHQRTHQGLKPFKCNDCDKAFKRSSALKEHVKLKHCPLVEKDPSKQYEDSPKEFICEYLDCNKIFKYSKSLLTHTKFVHTGELDRLVCELCGKKFFSKFALKEHSYIHTGELPHACKICPKKFRFKNGLRSHVMRHEGIKKCVCSVCGAEKATRTELNIHMNIHTKEKTFPCTICSTIYSSYNSLFQHNSYVHKGKKPYVCKYCNQAFNKTSSLKDHVMRHTGEKPHACKLCDQRFIQSSALKKHMNVHMKKNVA